MIKKGGQRIIRGEISSIKTFFSPERGKDNFMLTTQNFLPTYLFPKIQGVNLYIIGTEISNFSPNFPNFSNQTLYNALSKIALIWVVSVVILASISNAIMRMKGG